MKCVTCCLLIILSYHSNIMANQTDHSINNATIDSTNQTLLEIIKPDVMVDTNITSNNTINISNESKLNCTAISNETQSSLLLVNSSALMDYLESRPNISQSTASECVIVIFYYKWCVFSAKCAKHFNALARIYPQFRVLAIDAYGYNSVNMRYGLVGVPSVLLFHNGKLVCKLNDTEPTIQSYVTFITQLTGISPLLPPNITDQDLIGPLSSTPQPKFDFLLLISWLFSLSFFTYMFAKSNIFKTIAETVRNAWREAEAQHEHLD